MELQKVLGDAVAKAYSQLLVSRIMKSKRYYRLWENKGYHVTPVRYNEPLPDTRTLKDELWAKRSGLVGIEFNENKQVELLSTFKSKYYGEYESFPRDTVSPFEYYMNNVMFGSVDAEILYCIVRQFKPKRIYEIGSGFSTLLSAKAILKNKSEDKNYECELDAIEPYPNDALKVGLPGLSKLMPVKVQDVPLSEFDKLEENDILFIDSSHVAAIGSDVTYEYLEILPRLNKGVLIHAHDIFLPAEYPKEWIFKNFSFYNEQYLLRAFLLFNQSFEIIWGGSYMHLSCPDKLEAAFSSYNKNITWPGSLWMKKIK